MTCSVCKQDLEPEAFNRRSDVKRGRQYQCRRCNNAAVHEWYADHLLHKAQYNAVYKQRRLLEAHRSQLEVI